MGGNTLAFPEAFKETVRRHVPIEDVVGETVALRKVGGRLVGLCPFHSERTPSFSVSPERGLFYCFGCHAGGDVFDFVMRRDGVSFPEALRLLAERAGIPVPADSSPQDRRREELLSCLERAAAWYEARLWSAEGRAAEAYLARRRVSRETAERFRLGFAPPGPGILEALIRQGFSPERLTEAGLVRRRGDRWHPLFQGRLIFPIRDRAGRVIAFAGRRLGEGQGPKYLNSPETILFQKRAVLYDWFLSRRALRDRRQAILVEGYMDVLALHAVGFEEALASMGTALHPSQVELLAKTVPQVVILYDGDTAGREATQRSLWLLAQAGVEVQVAACPPGKDPDDLAQELGPQGIEGVLSRALPLTRFLAQHLLSAGPPSPKRKAEVADAVLKGILLLQDPVEQEAEIRQLAEVLAIPEEPLRQRIARMRNRWRKQGNGLEPEATRNTSRQRSLREEIEIDIITVLAREPSLLPQVTVSFVGRDTARILTALRRGEDPAGVEEESARQLWAWVCSRRSEGESSLALLLAHHRREGQKVRLDELRKEITRLEQSGQPVPAALIDEMVTLIRETKGPLEGGTTP